MAQTTAPAARAGSLLLLAATSGAAAASGASSAAVGPEGAAAGAAVSLSTYPAHEGAALSDPFTVQVAQHASTAAPPVYSSTSAARCAQIPPQKEKDECWCRPDRTQAWASVWFQGAPVTITVTSHLPGGWGDWSQVVLRPTAARIPLTRINATTLSLTLPPRGLGWKLSLESAPQTRAPAEGCGGYPPVVAHSLLLFADPESLAPDPGDARDQPGTLYVAVSSKSRPSYALLWR